ncbi:hypothetical protein ABZ499_26875 [Streptomyces sp. NPDC019990]
MTTTLRQAVAFWADGVPHGASAAPVGTHGGRWRRGPGVRRPVVHSSVVV